MRDRAAFSFASTGAVFLVPRETRGTLSLGLSNTVPVGVEGGDFEFQGVTPGTYDIIARLTAATGNGWGPYNTPQSATHAWAFGRATVDVRGADLANVTVVVRTGVDIRRDTSPRNFVEFITPLSLTKNLARSFR